MRAAPATRFSLKHEPEPNSGCWLWIGNGDRYGSFWWQGRNHFAHRASWLMHRGAIPVGMNVCHKCDTPLCVNPDHLFLGTQLDNRRDATRKDRQAKGERIGNAVLTTEAVIAIRAAHASGERPISIARRLGIKRVTASAIVAGRNWRHVAVPGWRPSAQARVSAAAPGGAAAPEGAIP